MKKPAALSQVEYLEKKLHQLQNEVVSLDEYDAYTKELYFQIGKVYSELELMKRVPPYD